jgi:hypothetical protein
MLQSTLTVPAVLRYLLYILEHVCRLSDLHLMAVKKF